MNCGRNIAIRLSRTRGINIKPAGLHNRWQSCDLRRKIEPCALRGGYAKKAPQRVAAGLLRVGHLRGGKGCPIVHTTAQEGVSSGLTKIRGDKRVSRPESNSAEAYLL